jgi:maleylacetoacetate isomerase
MSKRTSSMANEGAAEKEANKRPKSEEKSDEQLEVFGYWRSSSTWRVRICLEMLGMSYKYTPVDLRKGEQHSEVFVQKNSTGQVPAVVLPGGQVLGESAAIIEYLEEVYAGKDGRSSLFGSSSDPVTRALVRQVCSVVGSGIQSIQNLKVLKHVMTITQDPAKEKMAWGKHWITNGFVSLEKLLAKTSAKNRYCVGDEPTMADAFLVPQVYNANRFSVDMSQFPIISQIEAHLRDLQPFIRSHPSVMSDAD